MPEIDLREYTKSKPYPLSPAERVALSKIVTIEPAEDETDAYHLTPGSTVGALEIGDLSVRIQPKIGIPQLISLACYAIGKVRFQETDFNFPEHTALPDALAAALVAAAERAFRRGLLHGYRTEEEALHTVRGRIMMAEQIRRRFDLLLPVEVRYDDFTDDIPANQLVKAAATRLRALRLRSPETRHSLGRVAATLDNVSLVEFPPKHVPEVEFDRLNAHYREVVELSRLILRHGAFEAERGRIRTAGFLMDMNVVFQEFVTVALREKLEASERAFPSDRGLTHRISLDEGDQVGLKPDLSWWDGADCTFVGDAKYKRRVEEADLYQVLAYATALDLPGALLIYPQDDGVKPATYHVRHAGKRLEVTAVDLSGTIDDVLRSTGKLADRVRALRAEARRVRRAA